jgi:hypothetical protein
MKRTSRKAGRELCRGKMNAEHPCSPEEVRKGHRSVLKKDYWGDGGGQKWERINADTSDRQDECIISGVLNVPLSQSQFMPNDMKESIHTTAPYRAFINNPVTSLLIRGSCLTFLMGMVQKEEPESLAYRPAESRGTNGRTCLPNVILRDSEFQEKIDDPPQVSEKHKPSMSVVEHGSFERRLSMVTG